MRFPVSFGVGASDRTIETVVVSSSSQTNRRPPNDPRRIEFSFPSRVLRKGSGFGQVSLQDSCLSRTRVVPNLCRSGKRQGRDRGSGWVRLSGRRRGNGSVPTQMGSVLLLKFEPRFPGNNPTPFLYPPPSMSPGPVHPRLRMSTGPRPVGSVMTRYLAPIPPRCHR